ncbi:MAG TPA: TIGR03936 family radical SAM-associated protein [Acidimicrobiales bacterium]|nr:TIGR03936 family radical SAM-associated protein [Acidimicrobiales bacterium]
MTAIRVRFTKLGKVRFTSHRDVARIFERALRKAAIDVAYTEGFSPRPKIAFGLALSTGHESLAEYLDIALPESRDVDATEVPGRLSPALPAGIDVAAAAPVQPGDASLQESVTSCTWRIELRDTRLEAADRLVTTALAADELMLTRIRKGKEVTDDLRPAVLSLAIDDFADAGPHVALLAELATQPRGLRPNELLQVLDPEVEAGSVLRIAQWVARDGAKVEPLVPREDSSVVRDHPQHLALARRRSPAVA